MLTIGRDFHTHYPQIAMLDEATGGLIARRLEHESGEAQAFYRELPAPAATMSAPPNRLTVQISYYEVCGVGGHVSATPPLRA
jgi:hypothetical protein